MRSITSIVLAAVLVVTVACQEQRADEIAELRAEVATLRAEVQALKEPLALGTVGDARWDSEVLTQAEIIESRRALAEYLLAAAALAHREDLWSPDQARKDGEICRDHGVLVSETNLDLWPAPYKVLGLQLDFVCDQISARLERGEMDYLGWSLDMEFAEILLADVDLIPDLSSAQLRDAIDARR